MKLPEGGPSHRQVILMRSVLAILFLGAFLSGITTYGNLQDLSATYADAPPDMRRFMLYGPLVPMIAQVEARVPPQSPFLLITDVDPALIAYALFPRKIWQTSVDTALQPLFLPTVRSSYPERPAETFAVDWVLHLRPDNLPLGGELLPVQQGER